MNETYFVVFVIGLVLVSWILQKSVSTEGMEMETCSRPIRGPTEGEIYGPSPGGKAPAPAPTQNDSDVAESNTLLINPFPEEGPPQPYLTDFSAFHR
jgi:hypothetical protein